MDVFALIPARDGSKRVPKKNIRDVGGRPLIAHTIEQARAASTVDRAVVSTDDEEIAAVARDHSGEVPFMRPAELATDLATMAPVVIHALDWIEDQGYEPDIVVVLQVTTPLRTATDIDGAIETLRSDPEARSLVATTDFEVPPYWAVEESDEGYLRSHFDRDVLWTDEVERSQDLPSLSHPNGAIFAAEADAFRKEESFYTDRTLGYAMPAERSIDIDTASDLSVARALIESTDPSDSGANK